MMEYYNNYIKNIVQSNKEYYDEFAQAFTSKYFENTTLLKRVKEENYPFDNTYNEYIVQQSTVSDVTVNTTKIIGDYLLLQFEDCSHQNHRGQKYILEDNQTYLCYDKTEPLSRISSTKVIRCNNRIKWIDKDTNIIIEEPIFVGYELTSTNNNTTNSGITSQRRLVCLIQGNESTKKIKENARFMLNHNKAFKITEINNVVMEDINNEDSVNMLTFYIEWSAITPLDNKELNICDYYSDKYTLSIDQSDIEQIKGYTNKLTATLKLNGQIVKDSVLKWSTSDSNVVLIDEQGNYSIVGESGSIGQITCCMNDDIRVCDTINIKVVEDFLGEKVIRVSPIIDKLGQEESQEFICGVYINETKQKDLVKCVPNWIDDRYFTLKETISGYVLKNINTINKPLILTFSSGYCEPIEMKIELKGYFY